tara:strand:+ start:758 stop:1186 length:429 start_codon:yes stop_codon:yes gene_type:complete
MTQILCGHDDELAQWAETTYPDCCPLPRPLTAIGVASNEGDIMGVAIFHDFSDNDVQITFVTATPRWATPGNCRAILHYPFIQLGVKRMTAVTNKSNKRARKLLEGIGFKLEGVHPFADGGVRPKVSYGLYESVAKEKWFNG